MQSAQAARAAARSARYPIAYDAEFLERILDFHAGSEVLPGYGGWIADHMGGRVATFRARLAPHIRAFTDLDTQDILDFGCGTGSSLVVLDEARRGGTLTGIDVDRRGLEIARARARHHGIEARIEPIAPVERAGDLPFADDSFDFILANGVLEHVVPFSTRPQVVLEMWRLLRPGGLLYLSETPNALWPIDRHTTGLPFLPWLPSALAARIAVAAGRHRPDADLDARGRRGMTFWGVVRPLRRGGLPYEVLNVTRGGNRLLPGGIERTASARRRAAMLVLERLAARPLGALGLPTVAFAPFLEHLCLRKGPPVSASAPRRTRSGA